MRIGPSLVGLAALALALGCRPSSEGTGEPGRTGAAEPTRGAEATPSEVTGLEALPTHLERLGSETGCSGR